ncbi:MAG: LTA synthase family protein [Brevinematales bacterium]|nr:LTA synthase family protein [Brevinematales bacterium]
MKLDLKPNKKFIPIFLLLAFLIARSVKFVVFLSNISISIHFLKPISLIITGYVLYFLFLRRRIIFILVFLIENFWLLLNVIYFLYFDNYFHILNFLFHLDTNFTNVNEGISFLSALNSVGWISRILIVLIDLPFFLLLLLNYPSIRELLLKPFMKKVFISLILLLFISEVIFVIRKEGIINIISKLVSEGLSLREEQKLISRYGTIFVNFLDVFYIVNPGIANKTIKYGKIFEFAGDRTKKNVIIIQIESLDSSVIFTNYKGKPVTPYLRWLSTNSIFAPIVVSYHFAGYTSDAEFAVINSLHPLKDIPSMRYWKIFDNSIAKAFKANGYITYAFHNNRSTFFGREDAYKMMGFDKFFDISEMKLLEKGWGASDEDVFEYLKNTLLKLKNTNFFVYVITMSSHGPFNLVDKYYTNQIFNDINESITRAYFNSINYVDKVLSNFVTFVIKTIPNTLIVIFGDHHSSVRDSQYYKRSVSYVNGKVIEIVPLFIIGDKKLAILTPMSQIDISLTTIHLSGIRARIRSKGENILNHEKDEIFYLGEYVSKDKIKKGLNFNIAR